MSDKTETETLVTALGMLSQEVFESGNRGDADVLAKASLRLHDQAEEIERLKAKIAALTDAAHYAKGVAELAIRHRDEAEARAEKAYDDGWRTAANWMDRAELHDDIGSPAYIADRDAALGRSLLSVR